MWASREVGIAKIGKIDEFHVGMVGAFFLDFADSPNFAPLCLRFHRNPPGTKFFFFAFFYWSIIELWGKKHFCSPLDFTYFCTSCRAFSLRRGSEPYPICAFITATDLFLLVRISAILRLRLPQVGSAARPLAAYSKPVGHSLGPLQMAAAKKRPHF